MSDLYFCPTVGEIESAQGSGFKGGTCCAHPELHTYLGYSTPGIEAISRYLSDKARAEYRGPLVHPGQQDPTTIKMPSDADEAKQELLRLQALAREYRDARDDERVPADNALEHVTKAIARHDLVNLVGLEPHQDLPDPDHSFWALWRATARVAITAYNGYVEQSGHRYLSTGCRHGEHGYCQSNTGSQGDKRPAECKFCGSKCVCSCHTPGEITVVERIVNPQALTREEKTP
jgi:hypothetical protein